MKRRNVENNLRRLAMSAKIGVFENRNISIRGKSAMDG